MFIYTCYIEQLFALNINNWTFSIKSHNIILISHRFSQTKFIMSPSQYLCVSWGHKRVPIKYTWYTLNDKKNLLEGSQKWYLFYPTTIKHKIMLRI